MLFYFTTNIEETPHSPIHAYGKITGDKPTCSKCGRSENTILFKEKLKNG
jgi:hypothetical protein